MAGIFNLLGQGMDAIYRLLTGPECECIVAAMCRLCQTLIQLTGIENKTHKLWNIATTPILLWPTFGTHQYNYKITDTQQPALKQPNCPLTEGANIHLQHTQNIHCIKFITCGCNKT